jgi:hypothetical protein
MAISWLGAFREGHRAAGVTASVSSTAAARATLGNRGRH